MQVNQCPTAPKGFTTMGVRSAKINEGIAAGFMTSDPHATMEYELRNAQKNEFQTNAVLGITSKAEECSSTGCAGEIFCSDGCLRSDQFQPKPVSLKAGMPLEKWFSFVNSIVDRVERIEASEQKEVIDHAITRHFAFQRTNFFGFALNIYGNRVGCYPRFIPGVKPSVDYFRAYNVGQYEKGVPMAQQYSVHWRSQMTERAHSNIISGLNFVSANRVKKFSKRRYVKRTLQEQVSHIETWLLNCGITEPDVSKEIISNLTFVKFRESFENMSKAMVMVPHFGYICALRAIYGWNLFTCEVLFEEIDALGVFPCNREEVTIDRKPEGWPVERTLWIWWLLDVCEMERGLHVRLPFYCFTKLCRVFCSRRYQPLCVFKRMRGIELERLLKFCVAIKYVDRDVDIPRLSLVSEFESDFHETQDPRWMVPNMDPVAVSDSVETNTAADPQGDKGLAEDQEKNTEITGGTDDVEAEFVESEPTAALTDENVEDRGVEVPVLTTRWGEIGNVTMNTTTPAGTILARIQLPSTALKVLDTTPIALTFKQYEWCIPKLKIKIVTNCSKQQLACTGAAFIYGYTERDRVVSLENLATLSTMPNVIMNGSFSTSTIIDIPYFSPYPLMPIVQNRWMSNLDLGTLLVYCIVPVNVAAGNPSSINYRIFASLEGTKFYGQRGYYTPYVPTPCVPIVQADMLSIKKAGASMLTNALLKPLVKEIGSKTANAVKNIEGELISAFDDVNRDAPTSSHRQMLFQTTTVDMPAGVGPKILNTLRLNPLGTTQHHPSDVGVDLKFDLDALKQCFGLEAIFVWPASAVPRTRLFETRVQLSPEEKSTFGNVLPGSNWATPADNLSTMYQTCRGKTEYKFIFIATGFHTGRLRITYEPGVSRTGSCDLDSVPFAVVDLGADMDKSTVVSFMVPYQVPLHQLLLRSAAAPYQEAERYWIGNMSVFVENSLVAPSTVGSQVSVLVYKRVTPEFEFAIPRNNLDMFEVAETGVVHFQNFRFLVQRQTADLTYQSFAVTSSGPGVTTVSYLVPTVASGNMISIQLVPTVTTTWHLMYGPTITNTVPLVVNVGWSGPDVLLIATVIGGRQWNRVVLKDETTYDYNVLGYTNGSAFSMGRTAITAVGPPFAFTPSTMMRPDMLVGGEDFRFEGATTKIDLFPTGPQMLASTTGEKHDNLKDLLRRFETWWIGTVSPSTPSVPAERWQIRLPVTFGSPILRETTVEDRLWMRTNKITKIADMFRFARGSIRWTITVSSDTPGTLESITMNVCHIPNLRGSFDRIAQTGVFWYPGNGYAVQTFSLKQNNVVAIEFPHYNLGRFAWNSSYLTRKPFLDTQVSLGTCLISFNGPLCVLRVEVQRALGDDTHFYVFNGCPRRQVPIMINQEYNLQDRPIPTNLPDEAPHVEEPPVIDLTTHGDIESNPGPIPSKYYQPDLFGIKEAMTDIRETSSMVRESAKSYKQLADKGVVLCDEIHSFLLKDERFVKYTDIVLQVIHVVANPNIKAFTISLTSILLKVIPYELLAIGVEKLGSLCSRMWHLAFGHRFQPDAPGVGESIWSCLCEVFSIKVSARDPMSRKFGAMLRMATLSEKMFGLIELVIEGVKVLLNRIYSKFYPDEVLFKVLTSPEVSTLIKDYILAVGEITNPKFEAGILASKEYTKYMFEMYEYGEILKANVPKLKIHQRDLYRQLIDAHRDLKRMCQKSVQCANKPLVRMEPFVLHVAGGPGVGKSYEADQMIQRLVAQMGVRVIGDPVFTKSPATKFMDGWNDHKLVLKYDDFNAINEAEPDSLNELIHLKSSAIYIGNFADTVDKQRCVHPRLILLCSNEVMPKHNDVKEIDAVNRRRDLLLYFKLSSNFKFCQWCISEQKKKGMGCIECRTLNKHLIDTGTHIIVSNIDPMSGTERSFKGISAGPIAIWRDHVVRIFDEFQTDEKRRYHDRLDAIEKLIHECADRPWDECVHSHPVLCMRNKFADKLQDHLGDGVKVKKNGNIWDVQHLGKTFATFNEPIDLLLGDEPLRSVKIKKFDMTRNPELLLQEAEDKIGVSHEGNSLKIFGAITAATAGIAYASVLRRRAKRVKKSGLANPCICTLIGLKRTISEKVAESRVAKLDYQNREYIYEGESSNRQVAMSVKEFKARSKSDLPPALYAEYESSVGCIRVENGLFELECDKCVKSRSRFDLKLEGWDPETVPCICELGEVKYEDIVVCGRLLKVNGVLTWSSCINCVGVPKHVARLLTFGIRTDDLSDPEMNETAVAIGKSMRYATGLYYAFLALRALYTHFWKKQRDEDEVSPDADSSYEPRKGNHVKMRTSGARARSMRHDSMAIDMSKILSKNYYHVQLPTTATHVLMVKDNFGIMTAHFWSLLRKSDSIILTCHGKEYSLVPDDFEGTEITADDSKGCARRVDLMFVKIRGVPFARDIRSFFADVEQLDNHSLYATFHNIRTKEKIVALPIKPMEMMMKYRDPVNIGDVLCVGFSYNFSDVGVKPVYDGACMSVLVDEVHQKIIGLHVASEFDTAWTCKGMSQLICREVINTLVGEVEAPKDVSVDGLTDLLCLPETLKNKVKILPVEQQALKLPEYIIPIAQVAVPVRHATITDIKESPLYGVLGESVKKPVFFLTEGEDLPGIEKMQIAISGNEPNVRWTEKDIKMARDAVMNEILTVMKPGTVVKGLRSVHEAILGVSDVKNMPGMDLTTSTGFPLNYRYTSKKTLIEVTGEGKGRRMIMDPALQEQHEAYMLLRAQAQVPPTIFHCVLKDERRKPEKREKPRLIQAGPVEYTIAARRLTMDFTAAFYDSKLSSFSAVGVDCLGPDWSIMYERLRWKNNIICGDVKNFGPTLPHELVSAVYWIINEWYDLYDENNKGQRTRKTMRNVIKEEVLNSMNVAYDTIFQTKCCSPSGQPLTVVVNTICMEMYLYMAYRIAMNGTDLTSWAKFKEHVDTLVYGDDIWVSVDPEISSKFNNLVLSRIFKEHGVAYTDIDKKDVVRPFVNIEDSSFLGRTPRFLNGYNVGALDEDLIKDIINWTKCKSEKNIDAHMLSTTRGVLTEYMFYGEQKHKEAFRKLNRYWLGRGYNLTGYTFNELYEKWRNKFPEFRKNGLCLYCRCELPEIELMDHIKTHPESPESERDESGLGPFWEETKYNLSY
ncbi:hypothetical protein [Hubei picorna-like virus 43]|uniref:hypothetical protein n=1 Tax=Hubei picorna-like virus 43 TaxID=1923124 RepID=UPI00090BC900|nr:hypothetical protein [Hubei picorna-like virus 43]APG77980.1 hypothetical protein [Hubei picorna-like virus 43]